MVNLKAVLYDGSYHPVDSNEMAFKMAAILAFKEAMPNAGATLLEPIGSLKVTIPDSYMGDVIGDLNKRRGRVMGMNPDGKGNTVVEAEVPMAEMSSYATIDTGYDPGQRLLPAGLRALRGSPQRYRPRSSPTPRQRNDSVNAMRPPLSGRPLVCREQEMRSLPNSLIGSMKPGLRFPQAGLTLGIAEPGMHPAGAGLLLHIHQYRHPSWPEWPWGIRFQSPQSRFPAGRSASVPLRSAGLRFP